MEIKAQFERSPAFGNARDERGVVTTSQMNNDDIGGNKKEDWDERWSMTASMENFIPGPAWRKQLILKFLRRYTTESDLVADFGCGCGVFLSHLVREMPGIHPIGIDQSETGLKYAQQQIPSADFFLCDLSQDRESFCKEIQGKIHLAVCSEVLEHMENPIIALKNIKSCLAFNGILIVTVPGGPLTFYKKNLGHLKHYTSTSLGTLLGKAGFNVIDIFCAGFPFYNLYEVLIMLRGKKLIKDVENSKTSGFSNMPASVRVASAFFRLVMNFNINFTQWGWQLLAIAQKNEEELG
ncbi:MAG: class I SAM-dependent methyltransferase [Synergistaceae bacterium]|jgi:2-polyprenyl-3-methyl-5-hydroxy-6-metoxy-1,4-benzoquinol methylase|nr:class I SAM-dependent methyltransferase [Synergistaceae bacterium]